jgi:hypothetical protein
MKPEVITRKHIRIFWISVGISAAFVLVLYAYGIWVPSPFPGKQVEKCEGARQTLAELENPVDRSVIDISKIEDARQLVEIECSKIH